MFVQLGFHLSCHADIDYLSHWLLQNLQSTLSSSSFRTCNLRNWCIVTFWNSCKLPRWESMSTTTPTTSTQPSTPAAKFRSVWRPQRSSPSGPGPPPSSRAPPWPVRWVKAAILQTCPTLRKAQYLLFVHIRAARRPRQSWHLDPRLFRLLLRRDR